ncbi:MAG: hypothetical protein ACOVN0_03030 [Niveispirillum sp.]|uniref:hypothetical protein n=1 Tax=Niveispirillum sp. TaxID=1917217 RepID=UPI003BA80710
MLNWFAKDVALPVEDGGSIPFNGGKVVLDAQERAVLAALSTQGARQIADLPALTGLDMETARTTVSSLAQRSLVLLSEGGAGLASGASFL